MCNAEELAKRQHGENASSKHPNFGTRRRRQQTETQSQHHLVTNWMPSCALKRDSLDPTNAHLKNEVPVCDIRTTQQR